MTPSGNSYDIIATGPVESRILTFILSSPIRITSAEVVRRLFLQWGIDKSESKRAIRRLVAERRLLYTQEFGRSFLVPSYLLPVRISRRIILKPPQCRFDPKSNEVVISLNHGAAFGVGSHPTTRLALRCLDHLLGCKTETMDSGECSALDVGTGSGVLAIAAVFLGMEKALGIDIDPCARYEARSNVKENGLGKCIVIEDQPVETLKSGFSLVTANLRYPTLMRMAERFVNLINGKGAVVLSGIQRDEVAEVVRRYSELGCILFQHVEESEWAGLSFHKLKA